MLKNKQKKFWTKFFNPLEVGSHIRIRSKFAPTPAWIYNGYLGEIVAINSDKYGVFYEIHIQRKDNPRMLDDDDVVTYRKKYLELIV